MTDIKWGPTGEMVYKRTYSRPKPEPGEKETWPETVERVVDGNLALVDSRYHSFNEREDLIRMMTNFQILPAGRHLWASGVKGAQHLMNCWVSGWEGSIEDHFYFTFMRLMEGGGVGANYSNRFLENFPLIQHFLSVEIVCDPGHADYEAMDKAGVLSTRYSPDWDGAFVVEDSREGWGAALVELIQSHYREDTQNYHRVFDVSRVRPAGARLKTFGGTASGPLPLARMLIEVCRILSETPGLRLSGIAAMEIDHAIAQCVVAGGVRRSARMAMMHWADPQIEEFIRLKNKLPDGSTPHWTTNISVEVDDRFWSALNNEEIAEDIDHANAVLSAISEGMLHNGEPGFWDSSLSNEGEPNRVDCTNPCGEIALEPWEPCNLGHVNLAGFIDSSGEIDYRGLYQAHRLMTRFLIRATFSEVSDPKSAEVLARNRRIGVGHLGVASFLAMKGVRYSDAHGDADVHEEVFDFSYLLSRLKVVVDQTAARFCHSLRIPVPVKTTTVAPTGSVAKLPGVSEGIHPIFARYFIRRVRLSTVDPDQRKMLEEYAAEGYHVEDSVTEANTAIVSIATKDTLVQAVAEIYGDELADHIVQGADDLTLSDMLRFQAMYQKYYANNAVSYTANLTSDDYTTEQVANILKRFGGQLKGATVFPDKSFVQAPYSRLTKEEYDAAFAKAVSDGIDEECANGSCPIR